MPVRAWRRRGPNWYFTDEGVPPGSIISGEKVAEVRGWIENYHKLKDRLKKISEINRELLRRGRERDR